MHKAYKKLLKNSESFEKRLIQIETLFSKDKESTVKNQETLFKNQNESLEKQYKCLEEMINSNKETLNKIEDDIELNKYIKDTKSSSKKKCAFYNAGFCKLKLCCPFVHPVFICANKNCWRK